MAGEFWSWNWGCREGMSGSRLEVVLNPFLFVYIFPPCFKLVAEAPHSRCMLLGHMLILTSQVIEPQDESIIPNYSVSLLAYNVKRVVGL